LLRSTTSVKEGMMNDKIDKLLQDETVAIKTGPSFFARSLDEHGVEVVQIDWASPAEGDAERIDLLNKLL